MLTPVNVMRQDPTLLAVGFSLAERMYIEELARSRILSTRESEQLNEALIEVVRSAVGPAGGYTPPTPRRKPTEEPSEPDVD